MLWIPERMMAPFTLRGNQLRKMCLAVEETRPENKDVRLFLLQKMNGSSLIHNLVQIDL